MRLLLRIIGIRIVETDDVLAIHLDGWLFRRYPVLAVRLADRIADRLER